MVGAARAVSPLEVPLSNPSFVPGFGAVAGAPPRLPHWINNAPYIAEDGLWIDDLAPATGAVRAHIARGDAAVVDRAVAAARAALRGPWGQTTAVERAALLDRAAALIEARLPDFAALESEDSGKPRALAARMDIPRAVENLRFFAGAARHDHTPCHTSGGPGGALNYTLRRPVGVCALVTPWNLPLYLLTWKVAPALAMGNTVVCKPSELTPATAAALAAIFAEIGLPDGVFNLVHGYGPEVGAPLVAHPDVALVSFTGGTVTGRAVAAAAAPSFKKLSLELGGKNATIVFADAVGTEAALDKVVDGVVRAAFTNQGQICLCGSRLLVEEPVRAAFTARLLEKVAAMRVGPPEGEVELGSLISHAHRDKVEGYLRLAVEEGGVVVGGERPDLGPEAAGGAFLRPAVVLGLPSSCRTATEEIFGPVLSVHGFVDEQDAVQQANCVRYGLSSSIWTTDLGRAHRMARSVEAGIVWINCWLSRDLRTPFGGVKESGLGREGGDWSLDFYSEAHNVCVALG
jgi:aminomuconate-semialdehyde/2-hydroxymuconate-6-semialdehyde dehydrogenase